MVQVHLGPLILLYGAVAQLGERLLCKQEVAGSIPTSSTLKITLKNILAIKANRFLVL